MMRIVSLHELIYGIMWLYSKKEWWLRDCLKSFCQEFNCSKGSPLYSEATTIFSFITLYLLAFLYIFHHDAKHGYLQVPASTALMAYERKNKCYNLMCSFNLSRIPTFHFLFQSRFICAYNQVFFVFCFFSSILESFRKSTKKSNPKRCKQIGLCFFLLPNSLFSDWFCFQWKNLMTKRMVLHENLIRHWKWQWNWGLNFQ